MSYLNSSWPRKVIDPPKKSIGHKFSTVMKRPSFGKIYALASAAILLVTCLYWSILGAKIQLSNADQLINGYLFGSLNDFKHAIIPSQHTFLLKWPPFALLKLLNFSSLSFIAVTTLCTLLTVGTLVYVFYRIDRRPHSIGTTCLALASILLLVPIQPYPGGLLPVNMAMIATRNLEYAFYIISLVLLVRGRRLLSFDVLTAVLVMGLLIASDKLFLSMSFVGATLALIIYSARRHWQLVAVASNWLLFTVVSTIVAYLYLGIVQAFHLTTVSTESINPYHLITSPKDLALGLFYTVFNILTNLGANPAHSATTIRAIPGVALHHLLTWASVAYLINLLILIAASIATVKIIMKSLQPSNAYFKRPSVRRNLAFCLVWSGVASIILFIGTKHDYVVDARYLSIWFFAITAAWVVYRKNRAIHKGQAVVVACLMLIGIAGGVWSTYAEYNADKAALNDVGHRNQLAAQTLAANHISLLVGDYWRVVPIKQVAKNQLTVNPLQDCNVSRNVLTSTNWQKPLDKQNFAYLLTINGSITDFPNCSFSKISSLYGMPTNSYILAGSFTHPRELLLVYKNGSHKTSTAKQIRSANTKTLPAVPNSSCDAPTDMVVVAHQDDDLLFMNPDLMSAIHHGYCVRTLYLTAGDAGTGRNYWLNREHGSRAAYGLMGSFSDNWSQNTISIGPNQYVTVSTPEENHNISLIFFHLPDGNLRGEGFSETSHASLKELTENKVLNIKTVDNKSVYTNKDLQSALVRLMEIYKPSLVRTQSSINSVKYEDHSDHQTVNKLAAAAFTQYQHSFNPNSKITYYMGYPGRERPANVSQPDLAKKEAVFLEYAKFDSFVCSSLKACNQTATYNAYLHRQYQVDR
jgi:LmbE family N-acetylglucosaminyl deacetylase